MMIMPRGLINLITRWTSRLLMIAAILTLIGLALMVWSMAEPTPMPVILAMSLGQGLGILAFLLFGIVVLVEQLRRQRDAGAQEAASSNGVAQGATSAPPPLASSRPSREASP